MDNIRFEEVAHLCKSVEELAVGEVKSQAAIAAAAIVTLIAAMPVEPKYASISNPQD